MRRACFLLALALATAGAAYTQEMDLQVELMGPLGTQSSHKGDRLFARVVTPDSFRGDTVEGKVTEVRSGGKIHGQSILNFTFETLQHSQAIPISTQVKSVVNSKGQADVDEEGRVIRKSGNVAKVLGGAGLGGLIGGLAGGGKGAAIGAGAGTAAAVILIEVAAEGPEIRFDPGSKIMLTAKARSGQPLTSLSPSAPVAPAAPQTASAPAPTAPPAATSSAPGSSPQPNFTALKDDFIPGEKLLLYDDFTDMAPDEAPPHWKVRGGALSLMAAGGVRQVTATSKVTMTPMAAGFPANFTVETDVKLDGDSRSGWYFYPKNADEQFLEVWTEPRGDQGAELRVYVRSREEMLNDSTAAIDLKQPVREALWIQDGRLRFYLNGQKVVDVNQVKLPPLETARLESEPYSDGKVSFQRIRIAESTPDFSRSIAATGRYVSHGILFDTDSDCLKVESGAVIKSIARGLEANPSLKLRIEGHTDSTGKAEHNLDLSKRRAEAVKAVLVSQFGVDAGRLAADGFGASKPIDSNDTPQGRAQNRRVEFVKQ